MTRPTISITNCETQETIIREMNDEEYAQFLLDQEKFKIKDEVNESSQVNT